MGKLMLTVQLDPKKATLADVQRKLKLQSDEIDKEFGVVSIDPDKDLYAVLVEEGAAGKVKGKKGVGGPFSNPKIEPFGRPR
jgi:cytochrome oxidase Cu insertion factor (SCO1/SenC/PrrC family)